MRLAAFAIVLVIALAAVLLWVSPPSSPQADAGTRIGKSSQVEGVGRTPAASAGAVALEPRREAIDPAATPARLHMLVLDPLEQPVRDADVYTGSDRLGSTDLDGRVEVVLADSSNSDLSVEHERFRTTLVPRSKIASHPDAEVLIVRLAHGGRLQGQAVRADGRPLGVSVQVLAIPSRLFAAGIAEGWPDWLDEPDVALVETSGDGTFLFTSLDPSEEYTLYAGGQCLGMHGPGKRSRVGDSEVTVTLHEVFVAKLRLLDSTGGALRGPHRSLSQAGILGSVRGGGFERLMMSPIARTLAGLPPSGRELLVYCARQVAAGVGYVEVRGQPRGYEPFAAELPLVSCGNEPDVIEFRAVPTAKGWGRLALQLPAQDARGQFTGSLGSLWLTDSMGGKIRYPLSWPRASTVLLEEVPQGEYGVVFEPDLRPPSGLRACVPDRVTIGSEPAALALLPERSVGGISVELPAGAPSVPVLNVLVMQGSVDASSTGLASLPGSSLRFPGRSAVIPWIRPGTYTIVCESPRTFGGWNATVTVADGELARAVLAPPSSTAVARERGTEPDARLLEHLQSTGRPATLIRLDR